MKKISACPVETQGWAKNWRKASGTSIVGAMRCSGVEFGRGSSLVMGESLLVSGTDEGVWAWVGEAEPGVEPGDVGAEETVEGVEGGKEGLIRMTEEERYQKVKVNSD